MNSSKQPNLIRYLRYVTLTHLEQLMTLRKCCCCFFIYFGCFLSFKTITALMHFLFSSLTMHDFLNQQT